MPPSIPPPGRDAPSGRRELAGPPSSFANHPIYFGVYIETANGSGQYQAAPDVLSTWNITEAVNENEITLTLSAAGLDSRKLGAAGAIGSEHFAHLLDMLQPSRRVMIAAAVNSDDPQILFRGFPMTTNIQWNKKAQTLTCTCVGEGDELLISDAKYQCLGTLMRRMPWTTWDANAPDLAAVDAIPLVYNPGGKPNRSAEPVTIKTADGKTHSVYLHVDPQRQPLTAAALMPGGPTVAPAFAKAEYWNFADALRNLILLYLVRPGTEIDVEDFLEDTKDLGNLAQPGDAKDPFRRAMGARVDSVVCAPMSVREALLRLCASAGLYFQIPLQRPKGHTTHKPVLRMFARLRDEQEETNSSQRKMGTPKLRDMPREAPFTSQVDKTAAEVLLDNKAGLECDLTFDARVVNGPVFLGGVKYYEVTLLLRPGWKPFAQLDNLPRGATQAEINQRSAALAFWDAELGEGDEFDDDGKPKSIYHGRHTDHFSASDVARLWIFPDDFSYYPNRGYARTGWDDELYSPLLPAPASGSAPGIHVDGLIGGGIADAAAWVQRKRPMRDTIGRKNKTDERSPVVRIAFDATNPRTALLPPSQGGATWREFTGGVKIDTERSALRFTTDNILTDAALRQDSEDSEATMIKAVIEGRFAVAVTCTVAGDDRLRYRATSATTVQHGRERSRLIDVGKRFVYLNRRGQNSQLNGTPPIIAPDQPKFEGRDDTLALEEFGDRQLREMGQVGLSGRITVPWIDSERTRGGWNVGDSFSGLAGIGLPFDGYPSIVAKTYSKNATGYATTYHLGDLRIAPDIGVKLFAGAQDEERG